MKRLACLVLLAAAAAFAQEGEKKEDHATEAHKEGGEGAEGHLEMWKWANFVVLAAGLGYLIGKNAGPFFDGRSQQIRKDMVESAAARKDAEASVADVERRLASLEIEIAAMRAESQQESQAETERLTRQTAAEIAKIQTHSEQEIVAAGKAARMELKRYSAELAVDLAEKKIRDRMTPVAQDDLVQSFVHSLK